MGNEGHQEGATIAPERKSETEQYARPVEGHAIRPKHVAHHEAGRHEQPLTGALRKFLGSEVKPYFSTVPERNGRRIDTPVTEADPVSEKSEARSEQPHQDEERELLHVVADQTMASLSQEDTRDYLVQFDALYQEVVSGQRPLLLLSVERNIHQVGLGGLKMIQRFTRKEGSKSGMVEDMIEKLIKNIHVRINALDAVIAAVKANPDVIQVTPQKNEKHIGEAAPRGGILSTEVKAEDETSHVWKETPVKV